MANSQLSAFLSAAEACALEMLMNAHYMSEQLKSIDAPEPYRTAILDMCGVLVGTKHDIVDEVWCARDAPQPAESSIMQMRVERILQYLGEEMPKLDALVRRLDSASTTDSACSGLLLLVGESATNIYSSYARVQEAASDYRCAVGISDAPA